MLSVSIEERNTWTADFCVSSECDKQQLSQISSLIASLIQPFCKRSFESECNVTLQYGNEPMSDASIALMVAVWLFVIYLALVLIWTIYDLVAPGDRLDSEQCK